MDTLAAGSVITSPSTSTSPALISFAAYERGTSKLWDTALSNLKVSFDNTWRDFTNPVYENVQIGVFNSDEVTLLRYKGKNYLGNVDTLLTYEGEYSKIVTGVIKDGSKITTTVNQTFA